MSEPATEADWRAFRTLRDVFRYAVSRFSAAGLVFGHGTTNALDEAAFIVLEGLHLPVDRLDIFLDARLTQADVARLAGLIEARVATRKPAAYLLNKTYIQGVPFYVDERAIVPRSFIGELLATGLAGEDGLIEAPEAVESVLDLVYGRRLARHSRRDGLSQRARRRCGPVGGRLGGRPAQCRGARAGGSRRPVSGRSFAPLGARRYDLILTNPPYVTRAAVAAFPPEYAWSSPCSPISAATTASTSCDASSRKRARI